ncbi:MAG: hypothetical protein KAJ93_04920 [Methanosarcinales archaeon]|nr:hypothetical protein [Methanosarcinales archaeon]
MTDKTTVIHHRIPDELAVFIDDMAQTIKYHNKAHVTAVAIQLLKDQHDGKIRVVRAKKARSQ